MALLVWIVIPKFITPAGFYLPVFLASVALTGSGDKTRIHYLAAVENKTSILHVPAEHVEQSVVRATDLQRLLVFPDRLFIGNVLYALYTKELAEARPINNLVLDLMVSQAVVAL